MKEDNHAKHQLHDGMILCIFFDIFFIFFIITQENSQARTIMVSPEGNGSGGDSWETAYQLISNALSVSTSGDTLWVEGGVYSDDFSINVNVTILGGFEGNQVKNQTRNRDPKNNPVILDGGGREDAALIGCISSCTVDGLTLMNDSHAGMIVSNNASPVFVNCIFKNNNVKTKFGGGVLVYSAAPSFYSCVFTGNSHGIGGGGLDIEEYSTVNISNCTISNNVSYNGSAGGISCSLSTLIMENCIVSNNSAYTNSPEVTVSKGGGVVIGGGGSFGIFRNCLIANNWSTKWRQLVIGTSTETNVSLDNCTIIGDLAADAHWRNAPPSMTNCILWGANGILAGEEGEADISYSCIQGGYTGEGNISEDPLFRDPTHGNYRLLPESPCIDTGDMSGPSDDLLGCHRPVDIAGIGREVTDTYDMGAYEVQLYEVPTPTQVPSQIDPSNSMLYN